METNKGSIARCIITCALVVASVLAQAQSSKTIKPFKANIPAAAISDLKSRVMATRWPSKETVNDQTQGVRLDQIQALVKYWGTKYDWRKAEAKLNALPQFTTNIDGIDVHFIHVKSSHPNALPIVMIHGWPGSVFELIKTIAPLTDPVAFGGKPEDAFDVVIPSMPGYGFSGKPVGTGWDADRMGRAFSELMNRLGYKKYLAAGGDWGSVVADKMAAQKPEGLIGIHVNMPATVPPGVAKALNNGEPAPAGLSEKENAAFESLKYLYTRGAGYAGMMVTRPQTLGYGLADSPVALASFFLDKMNEWTYSGGNAEKSLTKDEILDDISLYWLTNTGTSSAQLYWENNANNFNAVDISIPAAITVFPGEIYRAPKSWAEKSYHNLIYFNEVSKGGHFAQWEEPQLFAEELRAAFKSLR